MRITHEAVPKYLEYWLIIIKLHAQHFRYELPENYAFLIRYLLSKVMGAIF